MVNADSSNTNQTVLYRKWRPRHFDDVVGQEAVVTTLRHAVEMNKPAHAYLFSGPRGTGKTSIGRIMAKALNCPPDQEGNIDQSFASSFDNGTALDLIELDAASNRGIDEIRSLRENVNYSPAQGIYKIYLIDEAHMLTDAAFNALLKTLEEPPAHVIFILATTESHRIPNTILSRCQRFDFHKHTHVDIVKRLEKIAHGEDVGIELGVCDLIARQATGSLRDAENLLDQLVAYHGKNLTVDSVRTGLGLALDDRTHLLANAVITKDIAMGLSAISRARDDGVSMRIFTREVVSILRNALFVKTGSKEQLQMSDSELEILEKFAQSSAISSIVKGLSILGGIDFRGDAYDSVPVEIAFASLCMTIDEKNNAVDNSQELEKTEMRETKPLKAKPVQTSEPVVPDEDLVIKQPTDKKQPPQIEFAAPDVEDIPRELEVLRSEWDQIRLMAKKLNFKAGALLNTGYLKTLTDDEVEIGFRFPNHVEQLTHNDNGTLIEAVGQAISSIAGRDITVKAVLWEELNKSGPTPVQRTQGGHLVNEAIDLGAVRVED